MAMFRGQKRRGGLPPGSPQERLGLHHPPAGPGEAGLAAVALQLLGLHLSRTEGL